VCAPYDEAELTRQQVCTGFCSLLIDPPIHFTNLDFKVLTTTTNSTLRSSERTPDHRHGPTSRSVSAFDNGSASSRAREDGAWEEETCVGGRGGDMRRLTKANGCLGIKEFDTAMNQQVQEYIRRKLSNTTLYSDCIR
jgi:hypothetical protein